MRILFIDDDDIRTRSAREALSSYGGHSVTHVRTPMDAVEECRKNGANYDLIILDIIMPHYDLPEYRDFSIPKYFPNNHLGIYTGLALFIQIQEILKSPGNSIPIIIMTAIEDISRYLDEMLVTGRTYRKPANILYKPVFIKDLLEVVKNVKAR